MRARARGGGGATCRSMPVAMPMAKMLIMTNTSNQVVFVTNLGTTVKIIAQVLELKETRNRQRHGGGEKKRGWWQHA